MIYLRKLDMTESLQGLRSGTARDGALRRGQQQSLGAKKSS
jgi:hypothetical protein